MANSSRKQKVAQVKEEPTPLSSAGSTLIMPHDQDLEKSLLCGLLLDVNAFSLIADMVDEGSFYHPTHHIIFRAMKALFNRGLPTDIVQVISELKQSGDLESVGGEQYITSLSAYVATSAHVEAVAKRLQDLAILRKLIRNCHDLIRQAYNLADPAELLDRAMSSIYEIYTQRKNASFESIAEILDPLHEYLDKVYKRPGEAVTGVPTGFTRLDELTGGFQQGDFIVIAGRPSMGKTAFALGIALHAAEKGYPVGFFSLEMSKISLAMRLISSKARVSYHKLRQGTLNDSDYINVGLATSQLSDLPIYIDDTGSLGITDLRARARRMAQQCGVKIIFLDYLQLMKPPPADNREQEVAQISRALKLLARDLNIPVVALSQLSRDIEKRKGEKVPQLADLRDSGAIEQDADVVMFIHREAAYRKPPEEDEQLSPEEEEEMNTATVYLRKQRNGPPGTVKLFFHKDYATFENLVYPDENLSNNGDSHYSGRESPAPF